MELYSKLVQTPEEIGREERVQSRRVRYGYCYLSMPQHLLASSLTGYLSPDWFVVHAHFYQVHTILLFFPCLFTSWYL
ncbi:hypothetical protein MANES_05G027601v8 [Manihot esculenta]|uniref:Uncharacterized protein n=1 Tax=Manihot esculenta TaxID=3983 RepID=A0ACB7HMI2_MANES|nr:hypothetical protein MANES_05G027601v8 [Manihot esculenta]